MIKEREKKSSNRLSENGYKVGNDIGESEKLLN
jgi:hypothetical protein